MWKRYMVVSVAALASCAVPGPASFPSDSTSYGPDAVAALAEAPVWPTESIASTGRSTSGARIPDVEIREGANYATLKGGYYGPSTSDLDDGYIVNLAVGRYLNKLLSIEMEAGYFDAEGSTLDVSGIPLMLNARASIPLWVLEVYGGLGLGVTYYEADRPNLSDDDWLLGGNVLLGADLILADKFSLGLEGKYYVTDKAGGLVNDQLDAYALFITGGLRF